MGNKRANPDRVVARIASRQHGVITLAQLAETGLGKSGVSRRTAAGKLHRIHRGVYAVGHQRLSYRGRCKAAVLACGGQAAISHRSAAILWGILEGSEGPVEISLPSDGGRRQRNGIRVHRCASLAPGHVTKLGGIPVTRPARTLRDLSREVPRSLYLQVLRRALDKGLIDSGELRDRSELARSELERRFLRMCRRYRIPEPEVNTRVGGYEVDFFWRDVGLIVELDGYRHHGHRAAFEADRARDVRLQALGFRVLRFTWRQLDEDPGGVAATVRGLIQPPLAR